MKSSDGGEAFKSFAIRNATYEDCSAILECLRSAFAPYPRATRLRRSWIRFWPRRLFAMLWFRWKSRF